MKPTNDTILSLIALFIGSSLAFFTVTLNLCIVYVIKYATITRANPNWFFFLLSIVIFNAGFLLYSFRLWRLYFVGQDNSEEVMTPAKSNYRLRQEAKERLLALAKERGFDIHDAMQTSRLSRIETEYLLDECIQEGQLEATLYEDKFIYSKA